jgi:hypothetical protein
VKGNWGVSEWPLDAPYDGSQRRAVAVSIIRQSQRISQQPKLQEQVNTTSEVTAAKASNGQSNRSLPAVSLGKQREARPESLPGDPVADDASIVSRLNGPINLDFLDMDAVSDVSDVSSLHEAGKRPRPRGNED